MRVRYNRAVVANFTMLGAALAVLLSACAGSGDQHVAAAAQPGPADADKLLIVDCLLPPQVRQLGTSASYLAARQPVKTSAADCEIRGGEYVSYDRADYATALKVWLPDAKAGKPEAQNYVGQIYERGLGLPPDYVTAAQWYRKAAEQGFSPAEINLGNLYEKGLGVERNPTEALNWYRRAAGIKDQKIMFASAVMEAKASQAELQKLRDQVAEARQQADAYRRQLKDLHSRLEAKEAEVKKLQADRQDKQMLLNLLQQQAPSPDRDGNVQRLQQELSGYQQKLSDGQRELATLQKQADSYQQQIKQSAATITQAEQSQPPQIAVIDPPMNFTRGIPRAEMAPASQMKEIVGKVEAPAGVQRFTVNGRDEPLDEFHLFWTKVALTGDTTPVNLAVLDKRQREVKFQFLIQSPRGTSAPKAAPLNADGLALGKFYALIIGNDDYRNLPALKTASNDARAVEQVLRTRYGFSTRLLLNATRYQTLSALNDLRERLTPQDNLLIYFAGHGELDPINDRGNWLPVDADLDNSANWISNVAVTDIINAMRATRIMVVADSCYSGTLSDAAVPRYSEALPAAEQKEWLQAVLGLRARTVLTSGGVEPVLDIGAGAHSIFAKAFIDALANNHQLLEGYTLYRDVLKNVSAAAAAVNQHQTPEYAPIKHAGHEAGEFFFQPI